MKTWYFSIAISIAWVMSEIILAIIKHSRSDSTNRRDRSSLRFLWIIISLAVTAGVWLGLRGIAPIPFGRRYFLFIGLIFIIAGLVLRWAAILTLRHYFTVDVTIMAGHRLIDLGLYHHIRHPAYSGSLLSFLGLGLVFASYVSLAVIFIPILFAFLYRIRIEEAALVDAFGDEYVSYSARTKRLIPGIF
ncbi:MAG: isoprenylcysteine carboxylmethyltransferase family protein [candidate division Zixibacteria bacterium HGW-Zixibacteria-1]|nr:MAG: isoprenylcysteine carboxylmethyltransferase family protein [candidate division Zixibacteria bacterium HGW-Zixibacteria-1]